MSTHTIPLLLLLSTVGAAAVAFAGEQSATAPPAGAGLDLINERCAFCHSTAQVLSAHKTREEWASTVQLMLDRGADLDPDEQRVIVDYLATNFGAAKSAPAGEP